MRKITLMFIVLFIGLITFAQSVNSTLDVGPKGPQMASAKGTWTLQINHPFTRSASAGCETDGTNYYVTQWNSNLIWKVNMSGNVVDSFSISGVTGLRDLAYDGTYFYGGKSTNTIYKMDFSTTPPSLISTISSPNVSVRNICYDAAADNGNGGFWVGNWATDFSLVSRSGTVLATISSATHGLKSTYGTAYDTISAGGPYIWAISAGNPSNATIFQIKVSTGAQTGLTHDMTTNFPGATSGGGLWIESNIVTGTTTLGGLIQGTAIFGFDLASVVSDTFDIGVASINMGNLVPIGQNYNIEGQIENTGLQAITSFDLHYSVDGATAVTQNVTGVNIASYGTYNFTHSTPWSPTAGLHNVKVWTTNPNGHMDQNTDNDTATASATGYDPTSSIQRMPLYETFTSSTCGPCVAGNQNMDALFTANPNKWVCIKYQMSWPGNGDPYYTTEGNVRRNFYGINYVPRQEIDGGYDGNSSSVTQGDFDAAYAVPAFVGMSSYMIIDTVAHQFTVGVTIDPKIDLPAAAHLFVGVVEKTTYNNVGSNGETEFHWVMKKMVPNANGTAVAATAGTPFSKFFNYTFPGSYRLPPNANSPINVNTEHSVEEFSDLVAVCWIQNMNTKEVYQSCLSGITLGVAENHPEKLIASIYPNPATDVVNVNMDLPASVMVSLEIVSVTGQSIKKVDFGTQNKGSQKLTVDVSNLESGMYFFRFNIGGTSYMKPVVVR